MRIAQAAETGFDGISAKTQDEDWGMSETTSFVQVVQDGPLALVLIDNPPVNATSAAVRAQVMQIVDRLDHDPRPLRRW